jgi:aspartyl protease family protein
MPRPWGEPRPPARRPSRSGLFLWLGVLGAAGVMLVVLGHYFPTDGAFSDPYLIRTIGFLALASSSLLFIRKVNMKQTARNALMWLGVGFVLVLGFSYQEELKIAALRIRSDLMPEYPVETTAHEMVISESDGGGFRVYGKVNETTVKFLIDTGASDIVLSPADARRLGFDFGSLKFDHPYESANGIGHGATVEVEKLSVGNIELANVRVSINGAEMSSSLLGMAFLKRLKSFNVSGRTLILRH